MGLAKSTLEEMETMIINTYRNKTELVLITKISEEITKANEDQKETSTDAFLPA